MFDIKYLLLDNNTSGEKFRVHWSTEVPQVFRIQVESGTPTVTLKGCDTETGTYETIGTKACHAGANFWRVLTPYKYITATADAACTMGIVPAGQYTEPK